MTFANRPGLFATTQRLRERYERRNPKKRRLRPYLIPGEIPISSLKFRTELRDVMIHPKYVMIKATAFAGQHYKPEEFRAPNGNPEQDVRLITLVWGDGAVTEVAVQDPSMRAVSIITDRKTFDELVNGLGVGSNRHEVELRLDEARNDWVVRIEPLEPVPDPQ